jgi:hypothetical protein
MAECAQCKADTELHTNGVPVCVNCDQSHSNIHIRARLVRDLAEATLIADAASQSFQRVMGEIPTDLPHSDGIQRIKNFHSN